MFNIRFKKRQGRWFKSPGIWRKGAIQIEPL